MDFVGNSPCSTHWAGSALIQITDSSGGIKALCALLSQGTGGKSFPLLTISNQRYGEMLRGFISVIGGFLLAGCSWWHWMALGWFSLRDLRGISACPGSERTQSLPSCGMRLLCQKPGSLRGWQEQQRDYSLTIGLPSALPH